MVLDSNSLGAFSDENMMGKSKKQKQKKKPAKKQKKGRNR